MCCDLAALTDAGFEEEVDVMSSDQKAAQLQCTAASSQ